MTHDNHTEHYPWGKISFWNKLDPVGKNQATQAQISLLVRGLSQTLLTLKGSEAASDLDNLVCALDLAYERGGIDARAAVRKALGVKEPRE
jgi:hypothetical protein